MLKSLVSWFEENQRPLPWRASYDPYHVWVSEVMLQQTQVETALPYYERFIREFPTVEVLAAAKEERVLTLLQRDASLSRSQAETTVWQQIEEVFLALASDMQ